MLIQSNYQSDLSYADDSIEALSTFADLLTEYSDITFKLQLVKAIQGSQNRAKFYKTFYLRKKIGTKREINVPIKILKIAQRSLLSFLKENYKPHRTVFGFIEGKSIIDNARLHVKKKVIYSVDIKDFFPTITWQRLYGMFQKYPFNFSKESSRIITNIVTHKGVLPQGAPTSPYLSNMICRKLDSRLFKYSVKNNLTYSRYADDLTFSTSMKSIDENIILEIKNIINSEKFELNEKKERIMPFYTRQVVNGLVVNKRVNVKKNYIRSVRAILHNVRKSNWEEQVDKWTYFDDYPSYANYISKSITKKKFDKIQKIQRSEKLLLNPRDYIKTIESDLTILNSDNFETSTITNTKHFQKVIEGKINFIGAVRGTSDKIYTKLKDEYDLQILLNESDKLFAKYIRQMSQREVDILENKKLYDSFRDKLKKGNQESEIIKLAKDILEANWLSSNEEKDLLELYYRSLQTPYKTADFFKLFKEDNFFGGLVHPKEGQLNKLEMGEIYRNCKSYFDAFKWLLYLSNDIKDKLNKYLNHYEKFIKENPKVWPWDDKDFNEKVIMPFRKDFRIEGSSQATDLIDFLEKRTLESDFQHFNKKIIFPNDCKTIFTDVESVKDATVLILYSMTDNSCDDTINVKMSYTKNKQGYHEVSIFIFDNEGIIQKDPDLKTLFSNKLKRAVSLLRGLADWHINAKFSDNCSYQFDVMNNRKVKLENPIKGVAHKLTFYY